MLHSPWAPAPRMQPVARAGGARQRGAIIILVAITLVVMIGVLGMAIDLGQLYNRKAELHGVAQAAALAAAAQLNGTPAGIDAALLRANDIVTTYRYHYQKGTFAGADAALTFSTSPAAAGLWQLAGSARGSPATVYYARVDASLLGEGSGVVETVLIRALSSALATASVSHVAIAGRTTINMTPLGLCALSSTRAAARVNAGTPALTELVEFGFRRGVTYDLMQLNPNDTTPENFLINPIAGPGTPSSPAHMAISVAAPFVCSGAMWMPRVSGAAIGLERPFPLAALAPYLNTRFGSYTGTDCKASGAPPDANIKPFVANTASTGWMVSAPAGQSATSTMLAGALLTAADRPGSAGNTPGSYGPLWVYAKAVPFSKYTAGVPEPAGGYTPFSTSDWPTLYMTGVSATGYPSSPLASSPYMASTGAFYQSSLSPNSQFATRFRRLLYLPLLACPIASGTFVSGNIIGIGKFMMTVPATDTALYGEFAGAADEASLAGKVELFQ